jgi:hypothetical protein
MPLTTQTRLTELARPNRAHLLTIIGPAPLSRLSPTRGEGAFTLEGTLVKRLPERVASQPM